MFKKKQIITIVSVAVVSFLIGTTFNVTVATDGRNPFDKIWETINELRGEVDTIEEQIQKAKTIRFVDPTEYTQSAQNSYYTSPENATVFVWTPNNSSNNAILDIEFYCEIKAEWETDPPTLYASLYVAGALDSIKTAKKGTVSYTWTPMHINDNPGIMPNQNNYTFWVRIWSSGSGSQDYRVYFRNFNIILTAIDGMSAEYVDG